jgi:hypothetical protein
MAQLDVKPKTTSSVWIWVILALAILAALIYFLTNRNNNGTENTRSGPGADTSALINNKSIDYTTVHTVSNAEISKIISYSKNLSS